MNRSWTSKKKAKVYLTDVDEASEEEFDRYCDSQDAAEEFEAYDKCENDVSVVFAGWKRLPCLSIRYSL